MAVVKREIVDAVFEAFTIEFDELFPLCVVVTGVGGAFRALTTA